MNTVIFVDVDGPMIPARSMFLPGQTGITSKFDPCATSMLMRLVMKHRAQIVVSSVRRLDGYNKCTNLFEDNGVSHTMFHDDWRTTTERGSTRSQEIADWLYHHPEVTNWIALDDEVLDEALVPNAIQCDTYEGFSWVNFCDSDAVLSKSTPDQSQNAIADFIRRKQLGLLLKHFALNPTEIQGIMSRIQQGNPDESD